MPPVSDPADQATSDGARREAASPRARAEAKAPGLGEQIGSTRDALIGLVRAHIDLATAELNEIKGEVARAAALGAAAIGCLVVSGILLPIGGILFLGEWIFGSIGWGVLHGTLFLLVMAVAAVIAALRSGVGRPLLLALLIGIAASVVFGASATNRLWTALGDASGLGVDPVVRPLVVALVVTGVIGALAGASAGSRAGSAGSGLIGGLVAGLLVGALSAIAFEPRAGVALGIAIGLLASIALMAANLARSGTDTEALKARFWPQATIDTTKETIEWAKARSPLEPRS